MNTLQMTKIHPEAPWMYVAEKELWVKETPGPLATPRIVDYHSATDLRATSDEVAWCSAFANWVMRQAGIRGTNSAAARSWLNWGTPIDTPMFGCIVIFSRGSNPAQGHVAFFLNDDGMGGLRVLGGNQGDAVSIARYPKDRVLGYRWPGEKELRG